MGSAEHGCGVKHTSRLQSRFRRLPNILTINE